MRVHSSSPGAAARSVEETMSVNTQGRGPAHARADAGEELLELIENCFLVAEMRKILVAR